MVDFGQASTTWWLEAKCNQLLRTRGIMKMNDNFLWSPQDDFRFLLSYVQLFTLSEKHSIRNNVKKYDRFPGK